VQEVGGFECVGCVCIGCARMAEGVLGTDLESTEFKVWILGLMGRSPRRRCDRRGGGGGG